jgi:hypothetical protein
MSRFSLSSESATYSDEKLYLFGRNSDGRPATSGLMYVSQHCLAMSLGI